MRHRLQLLLLCLLSLSGWGQTVWTLRDTEWPNPMTLTVLVDGYTDEQGIEGLQHAQTVAEGFIGDPLFNSRRDRWRIRLVHVASHESGVSVYNGVQKDTRYHVVRGYGGTARLWVALNTWQAFQDAALTGITTNVVIIVLANSADYGGGGGSVATCSRHASSVEIARHEMGHTFADLADEYCTAYPGWFQQRKANSWPLSDAANVPWIGGYKVGCQYDCTGWLRPRLDCKMNHLNVPWCDVCASAYLAKLDARTAVTRRPLGSVPFLLTIRPKEVAVRQHHQPDGALAPPADD